MLITENNLLNFFLINLILKAFIGCTAAFPAGTPEAKKAEPAIPTPAPAPAPTPLPKVKIPAELKGADGGMSLSTFFDKLSTSDGKYPGGTAPAQPAAPSAAIIQEKSDEPSNRQARTFLIS